MLEIKSNEVSKLNSEAETSLCGSAGSEDNLSGDSFPRLERTTPQDKVGDVAPRTPLKKKKDDLTIEIIDQVVETPSDKREGCKTVCGSDTPQET